MTRKHFTEIAHEIYAARQLCTTDEARKAVDRVAEGLCTTFKRLNSAFDKTRFMAACGVSV